MIVVKVELHSAITGIVIEIARAHICHAGETGKLRDYFVRTLRGRSAAALDRGDVQRRGKVEKHPSEAVHVWHLVAKALAAMGYGK
jgi:hypothetical protein